ncbi:MAG TPA: hypothetical protein VD772_06990, partial [Anseongella sp.]|nr:hypothetical protein [Anseongella sp.]
NLSPAFRPPLPPKAGRSMVKAKEERPGLRYSGEPSASLRDGLCRAPLCSGAAHQAALAACPSNPFRKNGAAGRGDRLVKSLPGQRRGIVECPGIVRPGASGREGRA